MSEDGTPTHDSTPRLSRRRLLALAGAGTVGSLAGCGGGGDGNPGTTTSDATTTTAPDTTTTEGITGVFGGGYTRHVAKDGDYDAVVAADGSGDHETVQGAIDAVPARSTEETRIFVKSGTYREKIRLPGSKQRITLIGESAADTVLTYDDHADKTGDLGGELGTSGSSSFFLDGDDVTAKDLTFRNDAEPVAQAVAMRVDGDRTVFLNCRFVGNQDTLYTHADDSRQYYENCYVEGDVDFIFGGSTAFFQSCEIVCKPDGGYVTAASTPSMDLYGYVFRDCEVRPAEGTPDDSYYLGRPWKPYANVVFIDTYLGDHVKPAGWHNWDDPSKEATAYYGEHGNEGPGWTPEERVGWANIMSEETAGDYTLEKVFPRWSPTEELSTESA